MDSVAIAHLEAIHEGSQVGVLDALWNWHPHRDRALHNQFILRPVLMWVCSDFSTLC